MFERPLALWLLLLLPLVALPGVKVYLSGRRLGGALEALLRTLGFIALVATLAGLTVPVKAAARRLAVVVALDESRSIAPDQSAWMKSRVLELRQQMNPRDRLGVILFGRNAELVSPPGDPRLVRLEGAGVDPGATDIASALTMAASLFPARSEKRLVLLSDGNETAGHALDQVPALVESGVRVYAGAPPPSSSGRIAVTDFASPDPVRAHSSFALRLDIESEAGESVEATVTIAGDGKPLGSQTVRLSPGLNRFELPYKYDQPGAYLMSAEVGVAPPLVALNPRAETAVSVVAPPRLLVVSTSSPESLMSALRMRQYRVDLTAPRGLAEIAADYLPYQAVILADISADQLSAGAQEALRRYVADYGGGLVVTGTALRDQRFHSSALEKALPVEFRPQPPPPSREPIALFLCIDRSNSMSYDSRYPAVRDGERIGYAKQAALALLRQLDDTDYVGVIAFDSEPYVLARLRPLGQNRSGLEERIRMLQPGGGTDFKDALEIAEREILGSGLRVREVILLTDGDTNRQYHDHDALMADYARERIPVSTIRIGPDVENLRLLQDFAKITGGTFYRVEDIKKLPLLLVHLTHQAMDFNRHGRTTIEHSGMSSILSGIKVEEMPPIYFYATTAAKDGAAVPLAIKRDQQASPLLAAWQYGLGRSAIFAADPDSVGSLGWVKWDRYVEFWSQLVSWTMRQGDSGMFTLKAAETGAGVLRLTAIGADATPVGNLVSRITGPSTALDVSMTETGGSLYSGESPPLVRGKYKVALMVKQGDTEQVLLRREVAVRGPGAVDAEELRLKPPNEDLLGALSRQSGGGLDVPLAQVLKRTGASVTVYLGSEPYLLPLVIGLILGEVFVRRRFLGD